MRNKILKEKNKREALILIVIIFIYRFISIKYKMYTFLNTYVDVSKKNKKDPF